MEYVEGLLAVMGLLAGFMVVLISLWDSGDPQLGEEAFSGHPRTIHPDKERIAA